MIDVKEANEATGQDRKESFEKAMKKASENRNYGRAMADLFGDSEGTVIISADRFEMLVRKTERLNNQLGEYEEKIRQAHKFIDTVAREWAEKGSVIPRYDDISRMAEILGWTEPYEIHDIRTTQRMLRDRCTHPSKEGKEAAEDGEAAD